MRVQHFEQLVSDSEAMGSEVVILNFLRTTLRLINKIFLGHKAVVNFIQDIQSFVLTEEKVFTLILFDEFTVFTIVATMYVIFDRTIEFFH